MDPTTATPSGAEEVLISITIFTYTTQVYASVLARCSKLCKSILYSQVDEDGKPEDTDWIVVPLNEENDDYDGWLLLPACDESKEEAASFSMVAGYSAKAWTTALSALLDTFYGFEYPLSSLVDSIDATKGIIPITELAFALDAVPHFSQCISDSTLKNRDDNRAAFLALTQTPRKTPILLEFAYVFKIKNLYKDCMVLCMGPWDNPVYDQIRDPKLRQIATNVFKDLKQMVHDYGFGVARADRGDYDSDHEIEQEYNRADEIFKKVGKDLRREDLAAGISCSKTKYTRASPVLYKRMVKEERETDGRSWVSRALDTLLRSYLLLCDGRTGQEEFRNYFLCLDLYHTMTPWELEAQQNR